MVVAVSRATPALQTTRRARTVLPDGRNRRDLAVLHLRKLHACRNSLRAVGAHTRTLGVAADGVVGREACTRGGLLPLAAAVGWRGPGTAVGWGGPGTGAEWQAGARA